MAHSVQGGEAGLIFTLVVEAAVAVLAATLSHKFGGRHVPLTVVAIGAGGREVVHGPEVPAPGHGHDMIHSRGRFWPATGSAVGAKRITAQDGGAELLPPASFISLVIHRRVPKPYGE